MKTLAPHRHRAFTAIDGLAVVAVVLFLLIILFPALVAYQRRNHHRNTCIISLEQIGMSFRIWQRDNNDKYPMNVPVALGGTREMIATGNVVVCFQVMSNELATPKLLACSEDPQHPPYAANFGDSLTPANLSYFLALDASETNPQTILCGDDNLIQNRRPVFPGIVNLSTSPATWTFNRHHGAGNILLGDGSVQPVTQIGFTSSVGTFFATNRIVVP